MIKKWSNLYGKEIHLNDTVILNENLSLTLKTSKICEKIRPTDVYGVHDCYDKIKNKKYIDIVTNISNISNERINFENDFTAEFLINKKRYKANIILETINKDDFEKKLEIEENSNKICHIDILVDNSLLKKDSEIKLIINIKKERYNYNFKLVENDQNVKGNDSVNLENIDFKLENSNENFVNINYLGEKLDIGKINNFDNYNFIIKSCDFKRNITPKSPNGRYDYILEESGYTYLDMQIEVINKLDKTISQKELLGYITLLYNNDAELSCEKVTESSDGTQLFFDVVKNTIKPNETILYHITCKIPNIYEESGNPMDVIFYINGDNYIYKVK